MRDVSMKKKWLGTWLGALPLVFSAGLALAAPIDGSNDRPVPITPPDFGPSMQQMLDATFGAGQVNALTDQSSAAMWRTTTIPPSAQTVPLLRFENLCAGSDCTSNQFQEFGLFSATDTGGPIVRQAIFTGPAVPGANALLEWLDVDTIQISQAGAVDPGIHTGIFNGITYHNFGFYYKFTGDSSPFLYSYDEMNPASGQTQAAMLAYNAHSGSDTWLIAFDYNAWQPIQFAMDYNDMAVKIESITPVPEPESYAMLIAGLALMGFVVRRRQRGLAVA